MLSMFELDECRNHIDRASLDLYKLTKELRHDMTTLEGDIELSRNKGLCFVACEMEKKITNLKAMLKDYESLICMCEKAVAHIDDTKMDAQYMKSALPHS